MRYRIIITVLVAISCASVLAADPIRVVASELPPCVVADEELRGFSIDLWEALANELNLEYEIDLVDFEAKLAALRDKSADVGIGCISISYERERDLDFTHPVAANGFRVASLVESSLIPHFSNKSLLMLLLLFGFVVVFAHLMWWSEHGQPAISDKYFPGVFESVWFSLVTMSTVGYGDIAPRKWLGRICAVSLIFTGVTAFGVIFGQFAADAISDRVENPVDSAKDLRKYTVGTKRGTASVTFLNSMGVTTKTFNNLEEAAIAMHDGSIDVLMHDTLAVTHLVHRADDIQMTGPMFEPHYVGLALQGSSPMRESLNSAILKLQQDGRYQAIRDRWF